MRKFRIVAGLLLLALALPAHARSVVQKKQLARTQFETAERLREELNGRPVEERTRRDYQRVTDAYRNVYYTAPTSSKADAAVVAVAELLAETGRNFKDAKALHAAIGQYEFLRREYPGSKYRVDALFTIGQIYKADLNDPVQAKATFQEFLKRYPHTQMVEQARAAISEIDHPEKAEKKKIAKDAPKEREPRDQESRDKESREKETRDKEARDKELRDKDNKDKEKDSDSREAATAHDLTATKSTMPLVTGIRHWSTPDYTRVAIDVEAEVQYQAGRVPNPDRIFFDLHDTKLASTLVGKSFDVQDGFLRKIRVAQYLKGITRVVLEVDDLSDYSVFLLPNPYRLIIDIHGRPGRARKSVPKSDATQVASAQGLPRQARGERHDTDHVADKDTDTVAKNEQAAPNAPARSAVRADAGRGDAGGDKGGTAKPAVRNNEPPLHLETRTADGTTAALKPELEDANAVATKNGTVAVFSSPVKPANGERSGSSRNTARSSSPAAKTTTFDASVAKPSTAEPRNGEYSSSKPGRPPVTDTTKAPEMADAKLAVEPAPEKVKKVADKDDSAEPVTVARLDPPELKTSKPTSAPTFESVAPRETLPRGKRRATSDAAIHEARPTANGERSLIRALGLKIGRIVVDAGHGGHDTGTIGPGGLQEKDLVLDVALRLGKLLEGKMGADVIYTRDDDTFVPLETRTAIANQNEADLFISIHANSSNDASARGVETYYLNFTSSADALEVAARENAVSETSIHQLQDLVKKIALKEKIEESREFAAEVQKSLWTGISTKNATVRNRGVKKAPFIVLIGANMPSILAEISFLSNPTDEHRLQTPEYRQKIAEYLYAGIRKYVSGLSGVKVAQKRDTAR